MRTASTAWSSEVLVNFSSLLNPSFRGKCAHARDKTLIPLGKSMEGLILVLFQYLLWKVSGSGFNPQCSMMLVKECFTHSPRNPTNLFCTRDPPPVFHLFLILRTPAFCRNGQSTSLILGNNIAKNTGSGILRQVIPMQWSFLIYLWDTAIPEIYFIIGVLRFTCPFAPLWRPANLLLTWDCRVPPDLPSGWLLLDDVAADLWNNSF